MREARQGSLDSNHGMIVHRAVMSPNPVSIGFHHRIVITYKSTSSRPFVYIQLCIETNASERRPGLTHA